MAGYTGPVPNKNKHGRDSKTREPDAWLRWRLSAPDPAFSLGALAPGDKPFSSGDKAADRARVDALAQELDSLQNLFYADRRYKLLVVLQGIDTSGKDGTLRAVFGRMSPIGVRTVAWRAPSESERAHDFLWRIHWQVPAAGEVVCFNRSHYEDVLVPVVAGTVDAQEATRRYAHINSFERLQQRIDDPEKRWKFERGDLDVRKQWDAYQQAYERAVAATATPWAPWTIVPADSKTHRNLMIALAVSQALRGLDLRYPDPDPALRDLKVE